MLDTQPVSWRPRFMGGRPMDGDRADYMVRREQLAWLALERAYRELADVSLQDVGALDRDRRRVRDCRHRLETITAAIGWAVA